MIRWAVWSSAGMLCGCSSVEGLTGDESGKRGDLVFVPPDDLPPTMASTSLVSLSLSLELV